MKKTLAVWILMLQLSNSYSQNLVQNPSFDIFITCPGFGQFSSTYITSWDKPSIASSDYYNYNCPGIQPAVQAPRSGEGYSGIICYNFGTEYREYITGTFTTPLVAGTVYDVEFYVNLNDGYIQAIEEVGAYISITPPGFFTNVLHINVTPQVQNTSGALNDTANWKRVFGQYTATGGEQFITIGNFHDDAGTTITQPGTTGSYGSYYFIDDVSVMADSTTSIAEAPGQNYPQVHFNEGQLQVNFNEPNDWNFPVKINCYNISGVKIFWETCYSATGRFDFKKHSNGIYFVMLEDYSGKKYSQKLMITQ